MFPKSILLATGLIVSTLTPLLAQAPALPASTSLLSDDLQSFKTYGAAPDKASMAVVPVEGQAFLKAIQLTTIEKPARFWDYGTTKPLTAALHQGDVLWVSVWARCLSSRKESGEAIVEVALMQTVNGKEVRPLARELSFGPKWTQFTIPFAVKNDSEVGQARFAFRFGYGPQSAEIGGMQLLNYGPKVKLDDLPRTLIRYDGWAGDAPWRKAAAERIEQIRKGDLIVNVVDGAGHPVPDAQVQVRMKRHAFGWGTAISEEHILAQDADSVRYRQILETYFNKVVFDNALKWGSWLKPKIRENVLAALPWLEERDIAIRGHVMMWPSWQHEPPFLKELKDNPETLRKTIADHIAEQTKTLGSHLAEWDVINETYIHHTILDILGRQSMVDWFREAHAGAPQTKLFYNDFTMFQPGEGSQYFYDTIKFLKESGAPINAFGEQGHFASSPPGIPDVLATLDKFGSLGLPIQISEFDIDTDDRGLQADFMRDFMTAVFSHPSIMGVMQWGFWEKAHWLPRAALWDKDWNLNPHGKVWVDLITKTWWTNADGQTGPDGRYATRGFYGKYEITAKLGEKTKTVPCTLSPENKNCQITLP